MSPCAGLDDTPQPYGGYRSGGWRKRENLILRYLWLFIVCSILFVIALPILFVSLLAVPLVLFAALII